MTAIIESDGTKKRSIYLDVLRIMAAFLVIVNHTNSHVFQACAPGQGTWVLSVLWYYLSKIAVPLFVMVSGACLLGKVDSYRKIGWRALRVLIALIVFSYGYFLYDAWVNYGLWPRAVQLDHFFTMVWSQSITDGFWYLYFYIGLMVLLPLLQRMAKGMERRDLLYLMGVIFGFGALCTLIAHYVPALTLPSYFQAILWSGYIGLFFAGHYIHHFVNPTKKGLLCCGVVLLCSLGASLWLTVIEYGRVGVGEKYWFMDDRMQVSLPTIIAAMAAMVFVKALCARVVNEKTNLVLMTLGGCAFGIYLLQDWIIAQTKTRLFMPMCDVMPSMVAVILWEIGVFLVALGVAWMMKRVPWLKKIV